MKPIIGLEKEKRKPQKLNIRRAPPSGKANTEVQTDNKDEKNWSMGKIEGYTGTKFEGFPVSQSLKSQNIILDEKHITFTCAEEKACHKMILCEDLSFGKERVPIPCILDSDVMGKCACSVCVDNPNNHSETLTPWLEFSYVTKRTVDASLGLDTEVSIFLQPSLVFYLTKMIKYDFYQCRLHAQGVAAKNTNVCPLNVNMYTSLTVKTLMQRMYMGNP